MECIKLYLEGVGFRGIARLTGVSHVIVQRWVKELGDKIEHLRPETGKITQVNIMEIDEMWHFVQKKEQMLGLNSL